MAKGVRPTSSIAEKLARLARADPRLLYPVEHRGEDSQAHLAVVRSREALVGARTKLANPVPGMGKPFGGRLPKCAVASFHKKVPEHVPQALLPSLAPLLQTIASLSERIRDYDRELEAIAAEHYPQTQLMRQVPGVGELTALAFVLVVE